MNSKLKNYVDVVFAEIPRTQKSLELKTEILANMNEHYNELLIEGKTEVEAYARAVEGAGDFDELLKDLMPDSNLKEKIDAYRQKKARNTSISVMLYILGGIFLISFSTFFNYANSEIWGLLLLMMCALIATGLIVYTSLSVPHDVQPYVQSKAEDASGFKNQSSYQNLKSFLSFYWTVIVLIYLLVSFLTYRWDITWIIFIAAAAIEQLLKLLYSNFNNRGA